MDNQSKQTQMKGSLDRFCVSGSIRAVEGEERVVELSFSSEEPYSRWWGVEILDHTEGCMDLTRLNEIGCVLFNHKRDQVIGQVLKAWNENARGIARIRFDEDEASDVIYKKVQSGTLKGVSVGRFLGPCEIAKKWTPYEISIVSVPADPTVGVGREMEGHSGRTREYFETQLKLNFGRYGR